MTDFSLEALSDLLKKKLGMKRYTDQVVRALRLAFDGHKGQFRNSIDESSQKIPYIAHPVGVALLAVDNFETAGLNDKLDDVIAACLTHDLLEDTTVSISDLEASISPRAASLVLSLTKPLYSAISDRAERNEKFLQQIIDAGRTAVFIKLCDYMHNIGRPHLMPTRLLEKAIDRGKLHYGRLLESSALNESIRSSFLARVEAAEQERNQRRLKEKDQVLISSLSEAIAFCVSATKNKTLELHDILDVLHKVLRPQASHYESADELVSRIYGAEGPQNERNRALKELQAGILDTRSFKIPLKSEVSNIDIVYSTPIRLESSLQKENMIFLLFCKNEMPGWIDFSAVSAIVTILSDRLRASADRRMSELASELQHAGLNLSASLAYRSGWNVSQLLSLKVLLDNGAFVHSLLQAVVGDIVQSDRNLERVERIESRVKLPDSILKKIIDRKKYKDFHEIDDLVGFRIVCISQRYANDLADELVSALTSAKRLSAIAWMVEGNINVSDSIAESGYKAKHIRFSVSLPMHGARRVSCEIQLPTVFQDAWARISHRLSYKKEGVRSRTDALLEELSNLCATADKMLD